MMGESRNKHSVNVKLRYYVPFCLKIMKQMKNHVISASFKKKCHGQIQIQEILKWGQLGLMSTYKVRRKFAALSFCFCVEIWHFLEVNLANLFILDEITIANFKEQAGRNLILSVCIQRRGFPGAGVRGRPGKDFAFQILLFHKFFACDSHSYVILVLLA